MGGSAAVAYMREISPRHKVIGAKKRRFTGPNNSKPSDAPRQCAVRCLTGDNECAVIFSLYFHVRLVPAAVWPCPRAHAKSRAKIKLLIAATLLFYLNLNLNLKVAGMPCRRNGSAFHPNISFQQFPAHTPHQTPSKSPSYKLQGNIKTTTRDQGSFSLNTSMNPKHTSLVGRRNRVCATDRGRGP